MPRVTTLRRCSVALSAGAKDSQTSASISVSALPGRPEGKVPVPATWRSPSRPWPASARTLWRACAAAPASPATKIASIVPAESGACGRGGVASAMSSAAIT
jgi:uncharacterized lipoprotein YmbA